MTDKVWATASRQPAGALRAEPLSGVSGKAAHQAQGFILKRWIVDVGRYGSGCYVAPTRGKALAQAWHSDVFNGYSFGEFLGFTRCIRDRTDPPRFGDPITISGKPAFFVSCDSQYVQFAWPGGHFTLNSHPLDVEPEEYRPSAYRSASVDTLPKGRDAKQGSVRSKGSAVPSEETADAQPSEPRS